MNDKKSFDIFLIRKIPYLTNGLGILFLISAFTFIFLYFGISSDSASPEIKAFYLIETSTYKLLYGSGISACVTLFLYLWTRQMRSGLIIFNADFFELILKKEKQVIFFTTIRHIYCNDTENLRGDPNEKFTMTLEMGENKKVLIRIKNTNDIKSFVDKLVSCDKLEVSYSSIVAMD